MQVTEFRERYQQNYPYFLCHSLSALIKQTKNPGCSLGVWSTQCTYYSPANCSPRAGRCQPTPTVELASCRSARSGGAGALCWGPDVAAWPFGCPWWVLGTPRHRRELSALLPEQRAAGVVARSGTKWHPGCPLPHNQYLIWSTFVIFYMVQINIWLQLRPTIANSTRKVASKVVDEFIRCYLVPIARTSIASIKPFQLR